MKLIEELTVRNRFGMKPGLETIQAACAALSSPEKSLKGVIHVAGTNGKGAVCAILDACLRSAGHTVGRYTSPHLVSVNERFCLNGAPVPLATLDAISERLTASPLLASHTSSLTYFEFLTLVAFELYRDAQPDFTILETGLGGRLDATNVCHPALTVITRIGLDHCDVLGDTIEQIAAEKSGIIKPGVPVVLGRNLDCVRAVIEASAREVGAPFHYAPDLATDSEIPSDFSLAGTFNRENALTAIAALKVLCAKPSTIRCPLSVLLSGASQVVWPGRFQRIGNVIVDGAHNPPAAQALADALRDAGVKEKSLTLICGFCGDKDVDEVLRILSPFVARAIAVRTNNPRSLSPEDLVRRLNSLAIPATPSPSISSALSNLNPPPSISHTSYLISHISNLITGSLFLAGEALACLGAIPSESHFDPAEQLHSRGKI